MKAFITGSYAYGVPREDSDIDLCVAVSQHDEVLLSTLGKVGEEIKYGTARFGKLNIITFTTELPEELERWERWKKVNDELIARRPVTREEAVRIHKENKTSKFDTELKF